MYTPAYSKTVFFKNFKYQKNLQKPLLHRGSTGAAVIEVQRLLAYRGIYTDAMDGVFDLPLETAVKAFQHRVFLKEDGIVADLTWQALYTGAPVNMPVLKRGSREPAVVMLQKVLKAAGYYYDAINSELDESTELALRSFQRSNRLIDDGIVGDITWYVLSKVPH